MLLFAALTLHIGKCNLRTRRIIIYCWAQPCIIALLFLWYAVFETDGGLTMYVICSIQVFPSSMFYFVWNFMTINIMGNKTVPKFDWVHLESAKNSDHILQYKPFLCLSLHLASGYVCPPNWVQFGDNCYYISLRSNQYKSWDQASDVCKQMQGDLLSIESQQEFVSCVLFSNYEDCQPVLSFEERSYQHCFILYNCQIQ